MRRIRRQPIAGAIVFKSVFVSCLVCSGIWASLPAVAQAEPADSVIATLPIAPVVAQLPAPTNLAGPTSYPVVPGRRFYRGNNPNRPEIGGYLNLLRLIPIVGLLVLWVWSTYWIDQDSRGLKLDAAQWNAIALLSGVAAFLLVLVLPHFGIGFLAMSLLYAVPLGLYIRERNDRVPENSKVMTPRHIEKVVRRQLGRLGIDMGSRNTREESIGPPIEFIGKSVSGLGGDEGRSRQVENSKGYLAAKELVYDAILRRSTDIHLEPMKDQVATRYRVDGVMYPAEPFDRAVGDAVINIFKVLGAMDITERRRPQDGSFSADLEGRQIDFRVATQGTQAGEKLSLRILDQANSVSQLAHLGLRKQVQKKLANIIHQPHGLLLSCGPTGAGKSTTLFAALNEIDSYQRNIITVEDPVEYRLENVSQIEINSKSGQNFATSLRSILRQDPDVLMVGEIRDGETAKIACQAANTGHMVFSTIHANDTFTALFRLLDLGVEPFVISTSITAILGQRLVRKLCPDCKEAYKPSSELLKKANLAPDKIEAFYRPPTDPQYECPSCNGLGFRGRIGVFELLVITDRIRDMIRENPSMSAIKAEARKEGILYMQEEGLRLVVHGATSMQELLRVIK